MKFKVRRVLIAVADGSARKVVDRAAQIVGSSKAHIELFSVVRPPPPMLGMSRIDDTQITRSLVEAKRHQLEKLAGRLRDNGIAVTCTVAANASVIDAIVRRAKQTKAHLLAIEAHHHSLLARLFLSRHDYDLLRNSPVPLLIVKGGKIKPAAPILSQEAARKRRQSFSSSRAQVWISKSSETTLLSDTRAKERKRGLSDTTRTIPEEIPGGIRVSGFGRPRVKTTSRPREATPSTRPT